ncbi:flagellar hook-length control protein FliK [Thioclava sp. 15-R06ZXC-3]|uniref:Flagellar hook-length control protein FliK n=1 Tax=Thioclava arctica TaxID=3238301 RepID=A0ABV3TPX6_9RHOB
MTRTLTHALLPSSAAVPVDRAARADAHQARAFDSACSEACAVPRTGARDDHTRTDQGADVERAGATSKEASPDAQTQSDTALVTGVEETARDDARPIASRDASRVADRKDISSLDTMLARAAPGSGPAAAATTVKSDKASSVGEPGAQQAHAIPSNRNATLPPLPRDVDTTPVKPAQAEDLAMRAVSIAPRRQAAEIGADGMDRSAPGAEQLRAPGGRRMHDDKRHDPAVDVMPTQLSIPHGIPQILPQPVTPHSNRETERDAGAVAALAASSAPQPGALGPVTGLAPVQPLPTEPETQPQLLHSALSLASDGGGSAKITLHPQSLGTVVVRVDVTAQGVTHIHLSAETDAGYRALAAETGHLAQKLAQGGLNVGSVQAAMAGMPGGTNVLTPQPGVAGGAQAPQSGFADAGGAGGFAGDAQHQHAGGDQHRPHPQDTPWEAPLPPAGESDDKTVKAYA